MIAIVKLNSLENGINDQAIIEYILNFVNERHQSELPISVNIDKINQTFKDYTESSNKIGFAAMDGNKVVGIYLGEVAPYSFSDELVLVQKVARVEEEYRQVGIGEKLFEALKSWGKGKGCRYLTANIQLFGKYDVDASYRAFEKMGFKEFSRTYYKEI